MALSALCKTLARDLRFTTDSLLSTALTIRCVQPVRTKITDAAKKFGLPDKNVMKKMYKKPKLKLMLQGLHPNTYTHKPLPYPKTGGRSQAGRIFNKRIGGGNKQNLRLLDYTRNAISETEDMHEKVLQVKYDPLRSANIALVARGNHKRWIIASESMKIGDIITSSFKVPEIPVKYKEGNAHRLAAMPTGVTVYNIERFPGEGGKIARAAGAAGTLVRRVDDTCVIKMPSKREMAVSKDCMAVFGKASNLEVNARPIGSANRSRWLGIRPKSGKWHRKDGYCGRKIKPVKPIITYKTEKSDSGWVDS